MSALIMRERMLLQKREIKSFEGIEFNKKLIKNNKCKYH